MNHYAGIDAIEGVEGALQTQGAGALDATADRAASDNVPNNRHVVEGTPHEAIVDTVAMVGADLVVVGTERKRGEYRRLLGSVTERVTRMADVPVHVVKAET